jgi:uncharacterized repeat protein (TIGR01451 family)
MPSRFSRRGLLGLAAVLVVGVTLAAAADPAGGQTPPRFQCNGDLYVTTGSPTDMALTRVDQTTGALTPIGPGGLVANALGYNPDDDFLYGIGRDAPHRIVRVAANGTEASLGPATGTPGSWQLTFVGTFLPNGRYLVLGDNASPPTPRGTVPGTWAEIETDTNPPHVVRTFSHPSVGNNDLQDVAINPVDGHLYGHSTVRNQIVRIDRTTGAATPVGPTFPVPANAGSVFFDAFGRLWLYGSGDEPGTQDTLYRIDDVGAGAPVEVAGGPAVTNSDGASCPFTVGLDKTVDPAAACAGEEVTYRYTVTNEVTGERSVTADFLDDLPDDGRTFVAGSLVNPFGGQVNAYGGTDRLAITDLEIPSETTADIQVRVLLPPDLPAGTVLNQASLEDLSMASNQTIDSEFPDTPQLPDPTPLEVRQCADLGVDKTAGAPVVGPGHELEYTVRVTNHGPSDATDVDSVSDTLPPGLAYLEASASGELTTDGTVRWPAFDLPVGAQEELTVSTEAERDVRAHAGEDGRIENTARVQHPGDPNPANDRDDAEVAVDRPDLVVDKDDGLLLVGPGQELTYRITVRNTGAGVAHDVEVTDRLPDELEYVGASDGATYEAPATVRWPPFDLAPGAERALTVTATVDADTPAGTRIRNVAVAPHPDDPNPHDNEDDDRDGVGDDPAPDPRPPDEPVTDWLPRTGLAAISLVAIGLGLMVLGGVMWWYGGPTLR